MGIQMPTSELKPGDYVFFTALGLRRQGYGRIEADSVKMPDAYRIKVYNIVGGMRMNVKKSNCTPAPAPKPGQYGHK